MKSEEEVTQPSCYTGTLPCVIVKCSKTKHTTYQNLGTNCFFFFKSADKSNSAVRESISQNNLNNQSSCAP